MSRPDFEEYVTARSGMLLRFAYLLCGDRHLAEDLVQEVLIKAHRRWPAIKADNPDGYLKRALVRTHVTWLRRRASSEVATAAFEDQASGGRFDDAHAAREEMWALLARLPRAQRAVLVLRYFEDLDDQRIAELVGTATSTVRVHAHRGLATLRETLSQKADEAPSGAALLADVRRGVARAAVRRRAAAIGGVAVIVAAVLLLVSTLLPERSGPPIEPTPSPTSDLELVPTALTAPEFPYAFSYLPPGVGPAYVTREQVTIDEQSVDRTYATWVLFGDFDLKVGVSTDHAITETLTPEASTAITVNGAPALLLTYNQGSTRGIDWQRDGLWLHAEAVAEISVDDLERVAEGVVPGSTVAARAAAVDAIASVAIPATYTFYSWSLSKVCAQQARGVRGDLCVGLSTQSLPPPHAQDFTVDGQPAYTTPDGPGSPCLGCLVVERSDGRIVVVSLRGVPVTTADLVAIYRGVTFKS